MLFKIEIIEVGWYDDEDLPHDRCAHGDIQVTIEDEIVVERGGWWNLSAATLHLLRTICTDHTEENGVGEVLIPSEGHHWDHLPIEDTIHVTTAYPMQEGRNWWVVYQGKELLLETTSGKKVVVDREVYTKEIKKLVGAIEALFERSQPRLIPTDDYDRIADDLFWREWNNIKSEFMPELPPYTPKRISRV